jgi:COMPASS component SWD1
MSTGEAYLVDQRKAHRARVELCEVQEESDDEGAGSSNRVRYVLTYVSLVY